MKWIKVKTKEQVRVIQALGVAAIITGICMMIAGVIQ